MGAEWLYNGSRTYVTYPLAFKLMNIRLHVLCVHLHDSNRAFGAVARACRQFILSFKPAIHLPVARTIAVRYWQVRATSMCNVLLYFVPTSFEANVDVLLTQRPRI